MLNKRLENSELAVRHLIALIMAVFGPNGKSLGTPISAKSHTNENENYNAVSAKKATSSSSATASSAADVDQAEKKKVVVMQYPKTPSIPALISAVEDMLETDFSEDDGVTLPFDNPSWPSPTVCANALPMSRIKVPLAIPEIFDVEVPLPFFPS